MTEARDRRKYHHEYYLNNKDKIYANVEAWRLNNADKYVRYMQIKARRKHWLRLWKKLKGCFYCGYNKHSTALDFHHLNPETKQLKIAASGSTNIKKLIAEIRKCIVVCANCHRVIHEEERMVKKLPQAQYVGSRVFDTKGAAEAYAVSERGRKTKSGYKTRYEIDLDPQTGKFRVREFIYNTNAKGELV